LAAKVSSIKESAPATKGFNRVKKVKLRKRILLFLIISTKGRDTALSL